jgi:hypothetical protein
MVMHSTEFYIRQQKLIKIKTQIYPKSVLEVAGSVSSPFWAMLNMLTSELHVLTAQQMRGQLAFM